MDWVQCDGCNKWFHMVCVGLLKVELKPDEDFVCKSCSKGSTTNEAPGSRSSVGGGGGGGGSSSSAAGGSSTQPQTKVKRTANRSL